MTKRSHGLFVGKTRHLARHHRPSDLSIHSYIKKFNIGDKVAIVPKSNVRNIPHPRYKGRIGTIIDKRGSSYVVKVKIMSAERTLIVPPLHLEKVDIAKSKQ
ncbi:MAG: 50S ribosomal protein L21e [Candidatus Micrarchaeia archaeon]